MALVTLAYCTVLVPLAVGIPAVFVGLLVLVVVVVIVIAVVIVVTVVETGLCDMRPY